MSGVRDRIRDESICRRLEVLLIENKMRKNQLRWLGYAPRRAASAAVKRCGRIMFDVMARSRGRPKKTWVNTVKKDLKILNSVEQIAFIQLN